MLRFIQILKEIKKLWIEKKKLLKNSDSSLD
jgi:hypothetical protein